MSLALELLLVEANTQIYSNITEGIVRPYIPNNLRKKVFDCLYSVTWKKYVSLFKTEICMV